MFLRFSIEHLPAGGELAPSEEFRYLLILEGSGSCSSRHQHFSLRLHDVLALPQNAPLSMTADEPLLCGCIHVFDMQTPRTSLYHLPGEHTGLLRQLFYLALDVQSIDRPYFDTVRSSMHQLVYTVKDETVRKYRRMYTIEQYRNTQIQASQFQLNNIMEQFKVIFEGLINLGEIPECDIEMLTMEYCSPVSLMIQLCDREPERKEQ